MILLDTNVVSEAMRARPDEAVVAWLNEQAAEKLFLSAVTIGEITYGLRILPDGKRRSGLRERFEGFVARAFEGRVLAYDEAAARLCGELLGDRREHGRPLSLADARIAAIARRHHLAVATRNVRDFAECGLEVLNPFEAGRRSEGS